MNWFMNAGLRPPSPYDDQLLLELLQRLDERACLPGRLLEEFVVGALPPAEAAEVHTHLRQCVYCLSALSRLHSLHTSIERIRDGITFLTVGAGASPQVEADSHARPMPPVDLLGDSPVMVELRVKVARLLLRGQRGAQRLPPVLIEGETGTGKGLLARMIHQAGPRAGGPFVEMHCGAIPQGLLEAVLFGFESGSFTDARRAGPGAFQTAHGGTIFLDEIGSLPEALQATLLKVIHERTVRPPGSTRHEPEDVWILTATSLDLRGAVRAGVFREDLYHRLAAQTLTLPPLRERGNDILLLAEHFLEQACHKHDLPRRRLDVDTHDVLLAASWPGNVRQLQIVMERAALFAKTDVITARALNLQDRRTDRA